MSVHLGAERARRGRYGARPVHAQHVWIVVWDEVGIVVQLPVPVYVEAEVVTELGEEAAGEEGGGAAVDAFLGLPWL